MVEINCTEKSEFSLEKLQHLCLCRCWAWRFADVSCFYKTWLQKRSLSLFSLSRLHLALSSRCLALARTSKCSTKSSLRSSWTLQTYLKTVSCCHLGVCVCASLIWFVVEVLEVDQWWFEFVTFYIMVRFSQHILTQPSWKYTLFSCLSSRPQTFFKAH